MMERLNRSAGFAALFVALLALVLAVTVPALAQKGSARRKTAKKAAPVVKLVKGKIPARYLPAVARAKRADRLGADGATSETLTGSCSPETVDLGTWCLASALTPLEDDEIGKNDYLFATQKCVDLGGWLPTAAQLLGAAPRVKLAGTIDDSRLTATTDLDPSDGLKDRREMSSTLITTAAGSSAAGSQGVTDGSKGDPKQGEPDPVPLPANPLPETTQYVTVYDNHDKGGFAGGKPVSQPENFRCAFNKSEGAAQRESN
ncbi:hypothetical protein [Conexibacter sp. CPCC 206217]|uniref:hypothetical protein n=1 Tax=Conexibacter sp. CPCC 206217 TaxID=3064574 RepID=UPI002716BF61|nr:hypothetical protein [Conexibacter sp. CPCC 206217]MDO8212965.1 hypothetical protein [Conexibacter sp. CPCC 206217]